ncbi:MAG: glycosyltransferase [Actinomycetota bacterium]
MNVRLPAAGNPRPWGDRGPGGSPARAVVSGMLASVPAQGGATWAVLQYILGLQQLGFQTVFVEETSPEKLRPAGGPLEETEAGRWFSSVVTEFGLQQTACLVVSGTRKTLGMPYGDLLDQLAESDLLLNLSGVLKDPELLEACKHRVYLDLDPVFTQLWDLQGQDVGLHGHDRFATVGLGIGAEQCPVPTGGREWITTLPPVLLDFWPLLPPAPAGPFTTIGNWRGYGSVEHEGVAYGQKAHSMRKLIDLPERTREELVLAMAIHPAETRDLEALVGNGWKLVDPAAASTPHSYRDFIASSKGEFSAAKSGYVDSRCGWFSDRTACYLASGRPAVVEDTGAGSFVASGDGFLTFKDATGARDAIEEVAADYPRHARAAREFAQEYLDSRIVLSRLMESVL